MAAGEPALTAEQMMMRANPAMLAEHQSARARVEAMGIQPVLNQGEEPGEPAEPTPSPTAPTSEARLAVPPTEALLNGQRQGTR